MLFSRLLSDRFFKVCLTSQRRTVTNISWNKLTAESIEIEADSIISESKQRLDSVAAIPLADVSYDNCLKVLAEDDRRLKTRSLPLIAMQHLSTSRSIRDASCRFQNRVSDYMVEAAMRVDLFERLLALNGKGTDGFSDEPKRLLKHSIRDGRRNGLDREENVRQQVVDLKKKESALCIDYSKNLNEENSVYELTESQLAGMPESFLSGLEKSSGKYKVTLKYPHYNPIMEHCRVASTRRLLSQAFNSRCMDTNMPILEKVVGIRQELAKLLGYRSHAHNALETKMARSPERVHEFCQQLQEKAKPLADKEMNYLRALKSRDQAELDADDNGQMIYAYDLPYYKERLKETQYSVDQEELRQYFPCETVVSGLMRIYQTLLGLSFQQVEGAETWADDVTLWAVHDAVDGRLVGHFYLDLYPREGKFSHACMFEIQPGCLKDDGQRQTAVAVLIANCSKPTKQTPSLLTHHEVRVLFHEFGHVMHCLCAEAELAPFAGAAVESDFVECPSQMLENWIWQGESLRMMSGHHKSGAAIPDRLLDALIKSRQCSAGINTMHMLSLTVFDQAIHSAPNYQVVDVNETFARIRLEMTGVAALPGTAFPASFAHMCGGYDAQYYSYLYNSVYVLIETLKDKPVPALRWSELYSADMFESRFKREGILNTATGREYRQKVLRAGGTRDGLDIARDFLGRDVDIGPFLRTIGL